MSNEEKKVRLNSEKKIDNHLFKLKVGTVDKTNPEAIYFEGRTFISPIEEKRSYDGEISEIKYHLKKSISRNLKSSAYFRDKYILEFKIALNGIEYNKKSFLSFQLLVCQKEGQVKKLNDIKFGAANFINEIVFDLEDDIKMHDFSISKTKK